MEDTLFSWQTLATLTGAAMLVFLITLYTARIVDGWWKWGTDLYAVIWGFIILTLASLAMGANWHDWRTYGLTFCNSFLVAAAAGKLRDKSVTELERRKGVLLATGQADPVPSTVTSQTVRG
jgi:hypothetical protein